MRSLLWAGQRFEPTLDLYDYRARFYDPFSGSFISPDSLIPDPANPAAWNRYSYVYGNPVRYTDPSGHCGGPLDTVGIGDGGIDSLDRVCQGGGGPAGGSGGITGGGGRTGVQSGTATVHRHGKSHFSIEVSQGSRHVQTHQVIMTQDQNITRIFKATDVSLGNITSSSRPIKLNANAAFSRQQELLNTRNLGPYDKITNSCVSHVCDVLQSGGVTTPFPEGSAQLRFLLDLLK